MLYNVVSLSAVQKSESAEHIHPLPLKPASQHPHLTPPGHQHRDELPVLHGSFPLAISFTRGSVYTPVLTSQVISPFSSPCVHMSVLLVRF